MNTEKDVGLIYQAIPAIMAELPSIYKGRKNSAQNYSFRGIDDVYNAVNPVMAKHGVFMRAEMLGEPKREERPSKSGDGAGSGLSSSMSFGSAVGMQNICRIAYFWAIDIAFGVALSPLSIPSPSESV